jgi:hypothetical protein
MHQRFIEPEKKSPIFNEQGEGVQRLWKRYRHYYKQLNADDGKQSLTSRTQHYYTSSASGAASIKIETQNCGAFRHSLGRLAL